MHAHAVDLDRFGVEIDDQVAGMDDRLGMTFRAPHDRVDPISSANHRLPEPGRRYSIPSPPAELTPDG